ncbi:MAG: septum formation initiator family protein [bacterium]|nr:septum formation initiator family protein [bacterium]
MSRFSVSFRSVVCVAIGAILVYGLADSETGIRSWWELRGELSQARDRIERLEESNSGLRAEVKDLRSDPWAMERAIREDLQLARPGEAIVRFVPTRSKR